jgi:large subunit ribosomal protein L1
MANTEGKRYQEANDLVEEQGDAVGLREAAELAKETATASFDESIDLDLRLGVNPQHADQMVRGSITLPNGTGRDVTVLVLASEGKQEEAEEA